MHLLLLLIMLALRLMQIDDASVCPLVPLPPQLQPASMSGRAALLATSPEQAHAAAHATAMAAMAAGFSPHASLAAAYGLPEGATPYGSHPLLQVTREVH
jgi:hypothetical protein